MNTVSLKRDWFDPEGRLWRVRNNPHSMTWGKADLPKDADFIEAEAEAKKAPKKTEVKL